MSPHPELDSARVKLERAQEHMERLKTEQEAWARTHPQPFDFKLVDDPDPTKILAVVDHLDQPPGFLSALLGDVVHNLRSALDHVSWLLVRHGTTAQLSSRDERQVQFPIYDTRDAYDANRGRRLPGIRDVHDAIVRRHQPFQRAAKPEAHPLAVLRDLSNVDKHQNIHLTF